MIDRQQNFDYQHQFEVNKTIQPDRMTSYPMTWTESPKLAVETFGHQHLWSPTSVTNIDVTLESNPRKWHTTSILQLCLVRSYHE